MKPLIYEPGCGTHINDAAKEAVALAIRKNCDVTFDFNGQTITVHPDIETPKMVVARWRAAMDKAARDYENSPEGREAKRRSDADIKAKQKKLSAELKKLPLIATNEVSLIKWIKRVIPLMDRVGVVYSNESINRWLSKAGYTANFGVGQRPEWFNTRHRMGGYLVGQFMTCKWPGIVGYCDKYLEMKA